ncbi:hypothetical protein CALCODRAFT_439948, partial [Calocera cornea HHB12733]
GCPTKISADNSGPPMVCPRCHNPSVHGAKSRMWFEFCFVPLIPCQSEQIWYCPICSWEAAQAGNPQPALAQPGYGGPAQQQYTQPGYQPPPNAAQGWGAQGGWGNQGAHPYPSPGAPGQAGMPPYVPPQGGPPPQGKGGYQQGGGYGAPYPPGQPPPPPH